MKLGSVPVLSFDLGGSHVAACLLTPGEERGTVVSEPLQIENDATTLLEAIKRAGETACGLPHEGRQTPSGIAMAAPGPFDYADGISRMQHKHPALYGLDLRAHLSSHFTVSPRRVRFFKDADAFLMGEVVNHGLEQRRVAAIALGTGIGSAFYENGNVLSEDGRIPPAGEIWNLSWSGGIVEDVISTRALCATYTRRTTLQRSVKQIAAAAVGGDSVATEILQDFGNTLGTVVNAICYDFQPEVLLLGGGMARSASLFHRSMVASLTQVRPQIVVSTLFELAALHGALALWQQDELNEERLSVYAGGTHEIP